MLQRYTDQMVRDPLRDDKLGPKGLPGYERTGRAFGRGLESVGRFGLLAGMPALGAGAGYILGDGDPLATAGGAALGGLGSLASISRSGGILASSPLTGPSTGGSIGGYVGKKLDELSPRENHLVERVHQMSPNQGLAYIQQLEHEGSEQPHVLQAMKDAYNTRRIGVQEQLKVSAMGLPTNNDFRDPMDDDTAPRGYYDLHRPAKRIGGVLGGIASVAAPAVAGGVLEHALFGTGGAIGAGLGAAAGVPFMPVGRDIGRHLGRSAGIFAERFHPEENHAVEMIKRMNPQDAYVHVRSLERAGNTRPELIQKMKDAFNYRRDGLAFQAQAGVGQ